MSTDDPDGTRLLQEYIDKCSNWGRWGAEDQVGALNLVGPDEVRRAVGLVRNGKPISLTLAYDERGPQPGGFRTNSSTVRHRYRQRSRVRCARRAAGGFGPARGFGFSGDVLVMPTQSGTQWDALSHIFWEGKMWNGRSAGNVMARGAEVNGIENYTGRVVMRGVLVDVPPHRGVRSLEPGEAIRPDEVEACLDAHDLTMRRGDALLVRTGFMAARRGRWGDYAGGPAPGLSLHMAPWLHEVAAVATDTWGVEVRPNEIGYFQPLHVVSLVHGGIAFGEMFDLDALSADCGHDGVYEFLFVASPLPITGGSGAPVSDLAIK